MKLYGSVLSPFAQRVLIAARVKGHEIPVVPPPGGSVRSEAFAAISPMRRIPVLELDGWTIAESQAIVAHLDETLDGPPLLPADPRERARARTVAALVDVEVAAGLRHFVLRILFGAAVDPATLAYGRDQLARGLDAIERVRRDADSWAVGPQQTLADAVLFPFLILSEILEGMGDCGPLCSGRPALEAYFARMAADPIGARTLAEMREGFAQRAAAHAARTADTTPR